MGGSATLGMMIAAPDNSGGNERSYDSDTILTVRERNPRILFGK